LTEWSTGPIGLAVGTNLITVRAYDSAENESAVLVAVKRAVAEVEPDLPEEDPDPVDPDPVDSEPPASSDSDDGDAPDTVDEPVVVPDAGDDADATPEAPQADNGEADDDQVQTPSGSGSAGLCGGIGAIQLAVILLGMCACRRRGSG